MHRCFGVGENCPADGADELRNPTQSARELTAGETTARMKSRSGEAAGRHSGARRLSLASLGVSATEMAELLIGDYTSVEISGNRRELSETQHETKGRTLSSATPTLRTGLLTVSTLASKYRGTGGNSTKRRAERRPELLSSASPTIKAGLLMATLRASQCRELVRVQ